jgi:hypothetical protein
MTLLVELSEKLWWTNQDYSAVGMPPWFSMLIYHLGDEQQARWWPQFRDVVSPHRHEHHYTNCRSCKIYSGPMGGELFVWGTCLFWTKYGRKVQYIYIYIGRHFAWFKYFTCHLLLVPVLAPNYKQHICRRLMLEKLVFISWTLYQICLFKFIRVEGGATFMKHFKGGHKL